MLSYSVRIECPICGKVLEEVPDDFAPRPFCSDRCKSVDLYNWLSEKYCVSEPLSPEQSGDELE
ncbi:MAG TPA: DNA gyrase inhibitor YacG [Polyangiaceae bacterium]